MTEGTAAASRVAAAGLRAQSWLSWRLAPVAVALLSLAVGAVGLGRRSLSSDEATSIAQADGPLRAVLSRIVHHDPGEAGGLLLVKLASTVGRDAFTLRAPSVIALALAAGLMVVLGTLLLGRVAGFVAGLALALHAGAAEASWEVRPYALGMLGVVVATLLLVVALEHGGRTRWLAYGIAAVALPLAHPLAAAALLAHAAALVVRRDRVDVRLAGAALVVGLAVTGLLLGWMALDRHGDRTTAPALDLERLGRALAQPLGWNPFLVVAAVAGLVALFVVAQPARIWGGVLVAGLIAAPVVGLLLAAVALPVHTGALVLCSPGLALAAGAATSFVTSDQRMLTGALAVLVASSAVAIVVRLTEPPEQRWRALALEVRRLIAAGETVVVLPESGRDAFAYYAPYTRVRPYAGGEGAWIAVAAGSPEAAIATARPVVSTPRYALLRDSSFGTDLRLQHWVRP